MSNDKSKRLAKIIVIILVFIITIIALISIFRIQINNKIGIDVTRKSGWDSQASVIEKTIELNESLAASGLSVDFKLDDICISSDYRKPNNITDKILTLTGFNSSDTVIGCFKDESYTSVIIVSIGSYNTQYVKKINFYNNAVAVKAYDFIYDKKRVECNLNKDNTISCN